MTDFDFGFTAVDENELEAVQQLAQTATTSGAEVQKLEAKISISISENLRNFTS